MRTAALVALTALTVLAVVPAHADVRYSYVSDPFRFVTGAYQSGTLVTGSFVLAESFVPPVNPNAGPNWINVIPSTLSYSFTDGLQTFTQANSTANIMMPFDRQTGQPSPAQSALIAQYTQLPPMAGWFVIDIQSPTGGVRITTTQDWSASIWNGGETLPTIHYVTNPDGSGGHFEWNAVSGASAGVIQSQFGAAQMGGFWGNWTVQKAQYSVPERALLPRFTRMLKFGPGLGVEASVTARLQHVTAWGAAVLLGAPRDGIFISMPRVRVEVAEACSGLQTLVLMLAAALLIAAVLPARRRPWAFAVLIAAILLAIEANVLRVAGISIGLEQTAGTLARAWKDSIQMATTGFALAQLVALGRLIAHRAVPQLVAV
jgi:exosortase/archaeosortase family protein